MHWQDLPKQPHLLVSYWNVNKLLYGALLLFVLETVYYYRALESALLTERLEIIVFWLWCLLFSFVHVFLVLMDSWSRFQNYKRIKDYFFQHGFKPKIAKHYSSSKCQRMAVLAAAKELGLDTPVKRYYHQLGIRWYYFVPQFMLRDPLFFFKTYFWSRTFLEIYYEPKFNFRNYKNTPIEC